MKIKKTFSNTAQYRQQQTWFHWRGVDRMNRARRIRIATPLDVEMAEPRVLLSNITSLMASRPLASRSAAATATFGAATGYVSSATSVATPENQGPQGVNLALAPTGTLTPQEQRKEQFVAVYKGPYVIGPGRTDTEWQQIEIRGSGSANTMLHSDLQLKIIVPNDPKTQIGATSTIFDRNINSNSALAFDMTAPQVVEGKPANFDSAGRPNHLSQVSIDVNGSSGTYDQAYAQGVVDIKYFPGNKHAAGAIGQGIAIVKIRAQIYTAGVAFILGNSDLNPGGMSQAGVAHKKVT